MIKINVLKIVFWYEIKNLIIYKINYYIKSVNIVFKRKKNCFGYFYYIIVNRGIIINSKLNIIFSLKILWGREMNWYKLIGKDN